MAKFVSYEKEITSTVTTIKHTVRVKVNGRAADLKKALSNVPDEANIEQVIGDEVADMNYGVLLFEEEICRG